MNKPVQKFTKEYIERCKNLKKDEIIIFLENYRELLSNVNEKCKLISLKIEPSLLQAFKFKAELLGIPYQTLIKKLMKDFLKDS